MVNPLVGGYWQLVGPPAEWFSRAHMHVSAGSDWVYFIGCWMLCSSRGFAPDRSEQGVNRRFLRFILIICFGVASIRLAWQVPGVFEGLIVSVDGSLLSTFSNAVQTTGTIALLALFFTSTAYVGMLASLIPDRRLGAWARTVFWLTPVAYIAARAVMMAPFPSGVCSVLSAMLVLAASSLSAALFCWLHTDVRRLGQPSGGAAD